MAILVIVSKDVFYLYSGCYDRAWKEEAYLHLYKKGIRSPCSIPWSHMINSLCLHLRDTLFLTQECMTQEVVHSPLVIESYPSKKRKSILL